jgi:hypothetical protein
MSKFIENAIIQDAASGFYLNNEFNGLRYLVGDTTGDTVLLYQEESKQNSIKLDLSTVILKDVDGADVTPATIEGKAALISIFVSNVYTNTELYTLGKKVGDTNPIPMADVDQSNRDGLNTVFGDRVTGIRKTSIGAQFQYGIEEGTSDAEIISTGSINIVESMLVISSGVAIDGRARVQSTETIRYVPGQESYCNFTLVFSDPVINSKQFGGLFDDEDGFFVGYDVDAKFYFVRRRNSVDTKQEIDLVAFEKANDFALDPTKGNVYRITFGYLGFAPITLEVMRPIGGWVILSRFEYPNSSIVTHILQTFLPVRGEVENAGNNSDVVLKAGSLAAGITDGGGEDIAGRRFTFIGQPSFIIATNTTLVTFRNKANFQGRVNRVPARLLLISGSNELNKSAKWVIFRNPTLLAAPVPVWNDVDTNNSTLEYSLNAITDLALSTKYFLAWDVFRTGDFFEKVEDLRLDLFPNETASFVILTTGAGEAELSIRWSELF